MLKNRVSPFSHNVSHGTNLELEETILHELQICIQEISSDFCYVTRHKRMSSGANRRFLDLLFFHRSMHRLIAVELKLVELQPEHRARMEWYLKWLDKYEKQTGEGKSLGILICAGTQHTEIELLELSKNGLRVVDYVTQLPPRDLFEKKLCRAITMAQEQHAKKLLVDEV